MTLGQDITLGRLFSGNLPNISLSSQLNTLRQRAKGKNYAELEGKLNDIFYPKSRNYNFSEAQEKILEKEAQHLTENIIKNADVIIDKDSIEIDRSKTLNISFIKQSIQRAENTLEILPSKKNVRIEDIQDSLEKLREYINDAKKEVNDYVGSSIIESDENFNKFYIILHKLKSIASLSGLDNYSQNKGIILEEIFGGGASGTRSEKFNNFINGLSGELAEQGITGKRWGDSIQQRGKNFIYVANFKTDKTRKKPTDKQVFSQINIGNLGNITSTIKYNASAARQIKMDVLINFKSENSNSTETFRASLKNWGGNIRSLGETSILGAILRTSNDDTANIYSLYLLSKGNTLTMAHRIARLSILMDIVTGLSQKEGYADTLIINTGTSIKVINPISLIVKNYGQDFIKSYSEKEIEGVADKIFKNMKSIQSPGRTILYCGNIQAYLAAKKVEVLMNLKSEK